MSWQSTRWILLPLALLGATVRPAAAASCEEAWAAYNEFKARNVMEASQYPLTEEGAAVRAACGVDALPVPPGSDTPHRPILRKPPIPAEKPRAPQPASKS